MLACRTIGHAGLTVGSSGRLNLLNLETCFCAIAIKQATSNGSISNLVDATSTRFFQDRLAFLKVLARFSRKLFLWVAVLNRKNGIFVLTVLNTISGCSVVEVSAKTKLNLGLLPIVVVKKLA